jgi:hypothetical protein
MQTSQSGLERQKADDQDRSEMDKPLHGMV